jgi:hypothetical protein
MTFKEFAKSARHRYPNVTQKQLKMFWKMGDRNKNKRLSYNEFMKLIEIKVDYEGY